MCAEIESNECNQESSTTGLVLYLTQQLTLLILLLLGYIAALAIGME